MSTESTIEAFFKDARETINLKFKGWEKDLPHPGEKGGVRQRRVADLLSEVLPKRYGIGSGHIVASSGDVLMSPQIDIVVFDAIDGIELPVDDYYSLFPIESVFATIEVKSRLTASDGEDGPEGTIYECVESTSRIKTLDRTRHDLKPIHCIVFAYTTDWSSDESTQVMKWFKRFGEKYSMKLPDLIFVLDPSFALGSSGPSGYNDRGEFTNIYTREPLLFFVSDLIHRVSSMSIASTHLWHEYITWGEGDIIARVLRSKRSQKRAK